MAGVGYNPIDRAAHPAFRPLPPMTLRDLPLLLGDLPGFADVVSLAHDTRGHAQIDGLSGVTKSLAVAHLAQKLAAPILVVTYQNEQCQRLADDLRNFGIPAELLYTLPPSENRWLMRDKVDYRTVGERIAALTALASGARCVVIGTPEGVFQRTGPPSELLADPVELAPGGSVNLDWLLARLAGFGYTADTTVTRPGQFARRGGIVDIFPITAVAPVRMELFGDEIERLQTFDVGTQRSTSPCPRAVLYPVHEIALTPERIRRAAPAIREALQRRKMQLAAARNREAFDTLKELVEEDLGLLEAGIPFDRADEYRHFLEPEPICALDYLAFGGATGLVVLDEPLQVRAHWERLRAEIGASRERHFERGEMLEGADNEACCLDGIERAVRDFGSIVLSQLPRTYHDLPAARRLQVDTSVMESYRSRMSFLAEEIEVWRANGATCLVVSDQPQRVAEICRELGIETIVGSGATPAEGGGPLAVIEGRLRQGFKFTDLKLYVATDAELFGSVRPIAGRRRAAGGVPISSLLDLRVGDYVVHVHHGIGVYRGVVKRELEGAERDFLLIQYAGADRLYVPADQIDRVQRYLGGDGSPPVVNKIGGNEWQRTTRRAKEQARAIARELIELYAVRQASERPSYGEDSPWQAEMEEAFPYEETPSQWRAIQDVKADLQGVKPMDRLICGDVGFGKTEVAIRAAFRVVDSGKQVAVLCPTTVLAAQHHTTFSERLAAYPITIELLSRFRSPQNQRQTLARLAAGDVQIVIGTHRLLSQDVKFRDLGLLIVDEEQRFGVSQKERLKQLRRSVDVLTLSATPIPRTLSMALSGLRDMSVIDDPPSGRVPTLTQVREYNEELVRDAILRELERDGQVYYVHNRVETIAQVAQRLQRLVPDARIRIGHGQMSEDELERIMVDFYHRNYDILVCTTIIENGLDVPNVNTIIVDRADRMGLAQLYQLRGRVGRSDRQAYAYLLYPASRKLSSEAEQRLMAIREFTELGSGFKIAMRDLEIRGAGNLLGAEQSGAMASVGFDLYCQLLEQAVSELRGEPVADDVLPPVDLPVTAHIPEDYIPSEAERIYFYKRMSAVRSTEDIASLLEELEDRFGDPPRPVWTALDVLRLRLRAKHAGIAGIRTERKQVALKFAPGARLTAEAVRLLTLAYKQHRFTPDSVVLTLSGPNVMAEVEAMVGVLEEAFAQGRDIVRDGATRAAPAANQPGRGSRS